MGNFEEVSTHKMALEHIGWCVSYGMTPREVCESVRAFLRNPGWEDAFHIIERRCEEMMGGCNPLPTITEMVAK